MRNSTFQGHALALLGVLLLSPDALLIRFIGDDPFHITIWRGLFGGLAILLYNRLLDPRPIRDQIRPARYWKWIIISLTTCSQMAFVFAITHANVSDVLIILAFAPLLSALMSAIFLGELVTLRTWIATLVASVGLAMLLSQSGGLSDASGLFAATIAAATMAGQFVIMRGTPTANLTACVGFGNIVSGIICTGLAVKILPDASTYVPIIVMVVIVMPVPYVLFILSLRTISAAETSLIMLLETILGSLWVWLVLAEIPTLQTVLSGILIITTLTIYGFLILKDQTVIDKTKDH